MSTAAILKVPGAPALAYSACGQGPGVVFLHGIGGNRHNWGAQLPFFARQFRAIAWDARGYGDSDDYPEALDFPTFAADLHRLLDQEGLVAAHLVGLSMGGRIALDFYAGAPERVRSLTLVDTFPGYDDAFTPAAREAFLRLRKQPLLDGKTPREIAPMIARTLVSRRVEPAQETVLIESISALHPASYIKTLEAMTRYTPVADLTRIDVPTLVVVGDEDTLTPPLVSRRMAQAINGARLVILRGAGHLSNIEQPALFNTEVGEFLTAMPR